MKLFTKTSLIIILITSILSPIEAYAVTPGTTCPKAGKVIVNSGKVFTCIKLGTKLYWDNGVKPGSTNATTSATPTVSAADALVKSGCQSFPSAIVRLQNASGINFNPAFIAAQEAAGKISQAGSMDSKYASLSNAQRIIIQYAQAVGWGGSGYNGDINTVRTALATFNTSCNSNLSLR